MTEDPAKYEPLSGPTMGASREAWEKFKAEMESVSLTHPVRLGEYDPRHIRIEALRAAAVVVAGHGGPLWFGEPGDQQEAPVNEATIRIAKQFAAYLESGE